MIADALTKPTGIMGVQIAAHAPAGMMAKKSRSANTLIVNASTKVTTANLSGGNAKTVASVGAGR